MTALPRRYLVGCDGARSPGEAPDLVLSGAWRRTYE
jgi:hypothetical protein